MSCPSDSPDDYTALNELKAKPAFRQKFQVQDAWVDFDVSETAVTPLDPVLSLIMPLLCPIHSHSSRPCLASNTALAMPHTQACPALH